MPRLRWVLLMLLTAGCKKNPCIDMCQQYERWLHECDSTWEAEFSDRGWKSVDDCYDDYWGASDREQDQCRNTADEFDHKACY